MKAILNGVAVEGTPQEIMEYQRLQAEKAERKPFKNPYASDTDWMRGQTIITSGDPPGSIGSGSTAVKPFNPSTYPWAQDQVSGSTRVKRCEHPCYCTGACEGRTSADRQRKWANDYNNDTTGRFKDVICANL